jgi:hypothetical protein
MQFGKIITVHFENHMKHINTLLMLKQFVNDSNKCALKVNWVFYSLSLRTNEMTVAYERAKLVILETSQFSMQDQWQMRKRAVTFRLYDKIDGPVLLASKILHEVCRCCMNVHVRCNVQR